MPPTPEEFHFSNHAGIRSKERSFSREDAEDAIRSGKRVLPANPVKGTHGGLVHRFEKIINNRRLTIVAEIFKNQCYMVTGYWKEDKS